MADMNAFSLELLSLVLALVMTLLALASYNSYEKAKKLLGEREAELKSLQAGSWDFRQKASEAFADQKSLKLRIETLERSLALTNEQLDKERNQESQLRSELDQLRTEYEATKLNLTEAYKRLRNKE